ncbi:MAG TPA: sporulation membrane protein YtaF [Syntrophomonas sp.]|jgi:putative sporulation protein YtaF|nr:sporulation membrane protein YtaF [Syntrophomonas sp.]
MELFVMVMFALAVSADGFMVGLSYGLNKIRIPVLSLIVIAFASCLAVTTSMLIGQGLMTYLQPHGAANIGALVVIAVGIYFLLNAFREKINRLEIDDKEPFITFSIRFLGIIVQILKEPARADFDASGEISTREAFFLGLALALDALGAGVGVAMTGFNIFYTAITVGVVKFIVVNLGIILGHRVLSRRLQSISSWIPGLVLICIGLMEFV